MHGLSYPMPSDNLDRISDLLTKLDDSCREAAEIRDALARAAVQRRVWPADYAVVPAATKSVTPLDFSPTSTVDAVNS